VAEAELERDVRATIRASFIRDRATGARAGGPGQSRAVGMVPRRGGFLSHTAHAEVLLRG